MADFSDKAQEVVGRAKQAAGDLTDNDDLHAEGTAEEARAQLKQGVDAVAEKATKVTKEAADSVTDIPRRDNSNANRRGPHDGCRQRSSTNATSTKAGI